MIKRSDVLGRNLFDVFPDNPNDANADGANQLNASLQRVLTSKKMDQMAIQKYDIINPNTGAFEERHWSPVNSPVLDDKGNILYIVHQVEDVTETVKLKKDSDKLKLENQHLESIRQSQRMEAMGQLAGGVAHDFNNILAIIILLSENLLSNTQLPEFAKKSLSQILKGSEKAKGLTQQLLAFSRKQVYQPKVINVNNVVTDLKELLERLLDDRFELDTLLCNETVHTLIDPGQVEQVLLNLVVNARDAMKDGGKITITTSIVTLDNNMSSEILNSEPGDYVVIAVRDTGSGMDSTTKAKMFEPFFTTKDVGKGTGLGLATVYGIVEQNKGKIWVYSEVDKGTVFKIYLPIVSEQQNSVRTIKPGSKDQSGDNEQTETKKIILVVEDEKDLREAICLVLQNAGYTVYQAHNGAVALEMLAANEINPHLIISDIMMPELTGLQMAERLKALGRNDKILFLSGYAEEIAGFHVGEKPDFDFLSKPFQLSLLLKKVKELLFT